ncbi:MAG: hypothetical protein IKO23_08395 [Bacteroidales bacterium]|jgi:hypothetical protein|nr:hypothetical protein [Bacteroidales bacterium]
MKNKNLLLGIILLFVGVVALLASLDIFEFRWSIVWHLWPLLLIIIGVMVLPVKDWLKAILLLASLAVGVLLYRYELSQSSWFQDLFSQVL